MESEDAVFTITTDALSPREVSEAVRMELGHKHSTPHSFAFQQQLLRSNLEQTPDPNHPEEFDVHVRVERTVKVERLPRAVQMEDYSRRSRGSWGRNVRSQH